MNIVFACSLFKRISDRCDLTNLPDDEMTLYGEAIDAVLNMPTHNSVPKSEILGVCRFLWNQLYEWEKSDEKEK